MSVRLAELENYLSAQIANEKRRDTFDMDDSVDWPCLESFAHLDAALKSLEIVVDPWRDADKRAMKSQSRHRQLARIAILAGTLAIVMAVVQLAAERTPSHVVKEIAGALEFIAVVSAFVAVIIGFRAKVDRNWLGQRHLAERLRMLKFRALERLWYLDPQPWQNWVEAQLEKLKGAQNFHNVEKWLDDEDVEPTTPTVERKAFDDVSSRALITYYRIKRVRFQARYFEKRHKEYKQKTEWWRRATLPLFFIGVLCVLAHFALEAWADYLNEIPLLETLALWSVALAAVVPTIGGGMRAWYAAFELPRSASLYAAKNGALVRAEEHIANDAYDIAKVRNHVARTEYFLENEHREWLRLLRDTEWFV